MSLEFRLALETDLRKVKKIVKTIGDEIAADPSLRLRCLLRSNRGRHRHRRLVDHVAHQVYGATGDGAL